MGYQLDARVDTLQNQARAGFLDHAQAAMAPAAQTLDDIAAYEQALVADSEPELNDLADGICLHAPRGSEHGDDWQKMDIAPLHGFCISFCTPSVSRGANATA